MIFTLRCWLHKKKIKIIKRLWKIEDFIRWHTLSRWDKLKVKLSNKLYEWAERLE